MILTRRRAVAGAIASASLVGTIRPAGAVIILDSTWSAEGGRPGHDKDGFRAHIALANQPQFDSLIALSEDDGEEWDDASGTWVGNFGGVGYVLTAAHVYKHGEQANSYLYRTQGGTVRRGTSLMTHPRYNGDGDNRSGYDVAIVRLDGPVTDAGPPPLLYGGEVKVGARIVIVGFGSRGLGSTGEKSVYDWPQNNKTAAENTVDKITAPDDDDDDDEDAGNWLRVTLRKESEGASRLDGILGGGDSGGSAWMRVNGGWVVVGVNATGTGDTYGEHSYFARLSGVRLWLSSNLAGLRFTP